VVQHFTCLQTQRGFSHRCPEPQFLNLGLKGEEAFPRGTSVYLRDIHQMVKDGGEKPLVVVFACFGFLYLPPHTHISVKFFSGAA